MNALTLLVVGGLLFALRQRMPAAVEEGFEFAVALVLLALGGRALWKALGDKLGGHATHPSTVAPRALAVGLLHGLAGSGALAALVVAELPSLGLGLLFLALYGLGAMVGMGLLGAAVTWPLSRAARIPNASRWLVGATGVFSLVLGVVWGGPIALRFVLS